MKGNKKKKKVQLLVLNNNYPGQCLQLGSCRACIENTSAELNRLRALQWLNARGLGKVIGKACC